MAFFGDSFYKYETRINISSGPVRSFDYFLTKFHRVFQLSQVTHHRSLYRPKIRGKAHSMTYLCKHRGEAEM